MRACVSEWKRCVCVRERVEASGRVHAWMSEWKRCACVCVSEWKRIACVGECKCCACA